jgi:heme/copper-type cytochrome/quinol oxidase subunit 2
MIWCRRLKATQGCSVRIIIIMMMMMMIMIMIIIIIIILNMNYKTSNNAVPLLLLHSEIQNSPENSVLERLHIQTHTHTHTR